MICVLDMDDILPLVDSVECRQSANIGICELDIDNILPVLLRLQYWLHVECWWFGNIVIWHPDIDNILSTLLRYWAGVECWWSGNILVSALITLSKCWLKIFSPWMFLLQWQTRRLMLLFLYNGYLLLELLD